MSPSTPSAKRGPNRSPSRSSRPAGGVVGRTAPKGRRASRRGQRGAGKAEGRRGRLWRWRRVFFALGLVFILAIAGAGYLFTQVSLPPSEPPLLETTYMCSSEVQSGCSADNSLAQFSGGVDRQTVTYTELPPEVINAVLATEDRDFFKHGGVDPVGIARAFVANVRNEALTQGGSTITQQYVKQTFLTNERSFSRKAKEAALAVKVERELSKQEILTRYLNLIYFGRGAYGVQAASRAYFGKDVDQVTLPEAAYLAGLIRGPELADANLPDDNPKKAAQHAEAELQRSKALGSMLDSGFIDEAAYDAAMIDDWSSVIVRPESSGNFGTVARRDIGTEYFVDYVKSWLVGSGNFTDAEIYGGGLRIYTTLDLENQQMAYDAVTSTLDRPDDPAGSLVSIDSGGRVVAMMGGTDYDTSQVNLAVGTAGGGGGRQPGSSFKPIVLAEALNQGIPLTTVLDAPARKVFPDANNGDDWSVANYGDAGLGRLDLVDATKKSSNTAYAQLMLDVGPDNVVALAERLGVTATLEPYNSLVLGTAEVSPLDMASVYSTFADDGEHITPITVTKVTDAKGTVLYEPNTTPDRVLSEDVVAQVNWTLNQVVESGTATKAKFGQPTAGKTGTTEGYQDAWFVGYTCELTAAVWVGYPNGDGAGNPRGMTNVHGIKVAGGTLPTEIWRKYMEQAAADLESCSFERPSIAPAPPGTTVLSNAGSTTTTTTVPDEAATTTTAGESPTTEAPPTTSTTPPTTSPPTTSPPTTATPPTSADPP